MKSGVTDYCFTVCLLLCVHGMAAGRWMDEMAKQQSDFLHSRKKILNSVVCYSEYVDVFSQPK